MTTDPNEEDRRLAIAAGTGDRYAFEQLVMRHKAALYRLARRYVGDADEAYDIVQETFVSTWLSLRRFDPHQSFGGWLRTIALNKCRDHGRRRTVRRRMLSLFALEEASSTKSAESESERERDALALRRIQLLDQAIADLPRLYKEPLLLTTVGGLTQQEAAAQLNTTTKAIEMRIRRARMRLREACGGEPGAP